MARGARAEEELQEGVGHEEFKSEANCGATEQEQAAELTKQTARELNIQAPKKNPDGHLIFCERAFDGVHCY